MKLKKILIFSLLIFSTFLNGENDWAGKLRLQNKTKSMYLRVWLWNTRGVRYFRELYPGDKDLIKMQTKGAGTSDIKDMAVDVYYKNPKNNNGKGSYRGTYYFKDNIDVKNKATTNVYFYYNINKTFPLRKSIKIYHWGKDGYETHNTGYDNNCSMRIKNETNENLTIDFENSYKIFSEKNLKSKYKRQTTIRPGSSINIASPHYRDINARVIRSNGSGKKKFYINKNKKTYVYFRKRNGSIETRQHVNGKTIQYFRTIKQGRLVLHNESKNMIMKFTIPNLDNDQKKPNELILTPGKSGEIAIGKRALGLGAHNVQLRINTYNGTNFEGTFEWNKEINIKKGEFTHVFLKWNKDKIIKLRRKLYKPTKEDDVRFLKNDLIDQNYGHTAGGMGVVKFENETGKNIKIFSTIRKSGAFAPNILVELAPGESKSFPTGNKDNDIKDMVAMISGKENKARYWSKNVIVRENKVSKITFDLNKNKSLYRSVQQTSDMFTGRGASAKLLKISHEDREYGKKYSPRITYRIHNNSGKDISLEIRYSDLAKGAKIAGVVVGVTTLTLLAFYASLPGTVASSSVFQGAAANTAYSITGSNSGLIYNIAYTAACKQITAGAAAMKSAAITELTKVLLITGASSTLPSLGTLLIISGNINSLDSKIGFIGSINNKDEFVPSTVGSKTSNGFIVALPKDCTFWGFEAKDIHDIKVTSHIDGNKIYYDDQHKFKIYKEFHPNNNTFSKLKDKNSKKIDIRRDGDKITEIRINPDFSIYASEPIEKKDHKDSDGNNYYKENGFFADRNILQKLNLI